MILKKGYRPRKKTEIWELQAWENSFVRVITSENLFEFQFAFECLFDSLINWVLPQNEINEKWI